MLENMTTGEKALIGATAIGIAALVFHKPTRNAVGLSDRRKPRIQHKKIYEEVKKLTEMTKKLHDGKITFEEWEEQNKKLKSLYH